MSGQETLDPAPFRTWADRWIKTYRDPDGALSEEGADATKALALELRLNARILYRWRFESRRLGRGGVEAALEHAGVFLWEVYEDEGFCTNCDQRVNVEPDGSCLICSGPTAQAMSRVERRVRLSRECPKCSGNKAKGSLRCQSCHEANRTTTGGVHVKYNPEDYECRCGKRKQPSARRCWACYQAAGGHSGRKHSKGNHTLQKITEAVLVEAYELYGSGMSLRKTAAAVFDRTDYASPASCANGLHKAFKARGWELRDRKQAVVATNRRRATERGLPYCDFVKASGDRCGRRTSKGRCWHHRRENLQARLAELHRRDGTARAAA